MTDIDFILVSELDGIAATRQQQAEAVVRGDRVRIRRGAYVSARDWASAKPRDRHLARMRALARARRGNVVFSHASAAIIHGLPLLVDDPPRMHIAVGLSGSRSAPPDVAIHTTRMREPDVVERRGLRVTSVERTVLDLAAGADLADAIMAADRALLVDRLGRREALATIESLTAAYALSGDRRAFRRIGHVLGFAATGAETPIESTSRLSMWQVGFPRPELQTEWGDARGRIGYTDFTWPDFAAIGEADGRGKYTDPDILRGRTPQQAVLEEKDREDRLRAVSRGFARWPWAIAVSPARLRARLAPLDLPIGRRWTISSPL